MASVDARLAHVVAGTFDDLQTAVGPRLGEGIGGSRWAQEIVAALHDVARDALELSGFAQELARLEEEAVADVVPFHDRRRRQAALRRRLAFEARLARRQHREPALIGGPDARGAPLHRRVGIGEAGKVGGERIGALGLGQVADEIGVEIGAENLRTVDEGPLDLLRCAEEDRAQHEPQHAVGVCLRVGERERRAPRAADEEPTLDAEMLADALEVGDEMRRRVGLEREVRMAAAASALIEQHRPEAIGIEQRAVEMLRAAARSPVQEQRRDAVGAADLLDVDPMAIADVEHARIVGAQLALGRLGASFLDRLAHGYSSGTRYVTTPRTCGWLSCPGGLSGRRTPE